MKYFLYGVSALVLGSIAVVGLSMCSTAVNVATTPMRVINDTVRTENVINSYNGFFKLKSSFDTKVQQLALYKGNPDALPSNTFALQSVCTDLANQYNNNAEKLTSSFFRDNRLPQQLNPMDCQ